MVTTKTLQRRILDQLGKGPVGATQRAPEVAEALGAAAATVRSMLSHMARTKVIERTTRGAYRLRAPAATTQRGSGLDDVVTSMRIELAGALGLEGVPSWKTLLDTAHDLRNRAGVALPRQLTETLDIPFDASLEQTIARARTLMEDAIILDEVRRMLECDSGVLDRVKCLVARVDELRAYAEGRQRTVEDVEEQIEDAIQHAHVLEEWKENMEVGLRALRATLDLIDPNGRK